MHKNIRNYQNLNRIFWDYVIIIIIKGKPLFKFNKESKLEREQIGNLRFISIYS